MYSWENHDDGTESWFIMDWEHFELYSILDWPPWTAALACDHTEVLQVLIEKNIFVPRAWDFFNASGEGCFETLKVLVRACPEWAEHAQSEYSTILGLAISASWHNLDIAHFLVNSGFPTALTLINTLRWPWPRIPGTSRRFDFYWTVGPIPILQPHCGR